MKPAGGHIGGETPLLTAVKTTMLFVGSWIVGACLVVAMDRDVWARGAVPAPATLAFSPQTSSGQLVLPVAGVSVASLRDSFDEHRGLARRHEAIDILAPRGTPVVAAVDGSIAKLFTSGAGGLTIYEFDEPQSHVYYYAHLDGYRDGLRERSFVHRGEVIGYVGTTGNAPANTPHLHFAIGNLPPGRQWWKGEPINPYPLLRSGHLP
jgi:peptidoglycan LD-endopeptidase LytH